MQNGVETERKNTTIDISSGLVVFIMTNDGTVISVLTLSIQYMF